jgi:hypothetical protein
MMATVVPFRAQPQQLSRVRSRDRVLAVLVPKLLGILWDIGASPGLLGGISSVAGIDSDIEIGGSKFREGTFFLHVCVAPELGAWNWRKVFSAHVADRVFADPAYFPYCGGRCGILSWKRGPWEDRVMAQPSAPRTFAHLQTAGLTRQGVQT